MEHAGSLHHRVEYWVTVGADEPGPVMEVNMPDAPAFWAEHSPFSDPGELRDLLDRLPADPAALQRVSTGLVFHYRASGDPVACGFAPERMAEIDLRYAEDMLARLVELGGPLGPDRTSTQRILGCCRDFTLLLVAMARQHGIPARSRVGFAGYFGPPWWIDHVVAEIWDAGAQRWRLVEAQLPRGSVDANTGRTLDVLDVPRDRFLVGPDAWQAARAGRLDPERFVVAPDLDVPFLRSWSYLAHNLVVDLAALNRYEMLLWDGWGVLQTTDPPHPDLSADLDTVSAAIADPMVTPDEVARQFADERFRIPEEIVSHSPIDGSARQVPLRRSSR